MIQLFPLLEAKKMRKIARLGQAIFVDGIGLQCESVYLLIFSLSLCMGTGTTSNPLNGGIDIS
jgi:hypothetical protein